MIIGNIKQLVTSSGIKRNNTNSAYQGWSWTYGGSLPAGSLGNIAFNPVENPPAIPATNNIYYIPTTDKFGIDTGTVTLFEAPSGGKTEIAPFNGTAATTITFSWTNNNGSGSASGVVSISVIMNGVTIFSSTSLSGNYVLTLSPSQAGWLLANGGTLKYRIYNGLNGNPASLSASVVISNDGLFFANVE